MAEHKELVTVKDFVVEGVVLKASRRPGQVVPKRRRKVDVASGRRPADQAWRVIRVGIDGPHSARPPRPCASLAVAVLRLHVRLDRLDGGGGIADPDVRQGVSQPRRLVLQGLLHLDLELLRNRRHVELVGGRPRSPGCEGGCSRCRCGAGRGGGRRRPGGRRRRVQVGQHHMALVDGELRPVGQHRVERGVSPVRRPIRSA